jgi:hypothetical protein
MLETKTHAHVLNFFTITFMVAKVARFSTIPEVSFVLRVTIIFEDFAPASKLSQTDPISMLRLLTMVRAQVP